MPSLTRMAVAGVGSLLLIGSMLTAAPAATAETRAADPAPAATATPSAAPSPSAGDQPVASATPGDGSTQVLTDDPSLSEQNRARNHSMGSTVAANEPAPVPAPKASTRMFSTLAATRPPGVPGLDVSGWQVMNASTWAQVWANGGRFAYVKATEATDYVSSQFTEQYTDSYNAGLLHGAYHFATPDSSSGAAQATWFLNHGGQGTADGRTMPPLLDIEYNPYGATCYGLSQAAMVSWIRDFSNTIQARTGRLPAIYSTTNWWVQCTGNSAAFSANPLFIARYPSSISDGAGTLPAGWSAYTLWQYASSGVFPGDQDVFNGSPTDLQTFGLGTSLARTVSSATVYLISGSVKYPVNSEVLLSALAPLGQVAYVAQSYLDGFPTQQAAGRIVRGPDGVMYFYDAGIKLPFSSCQLVEDYGGACNPAGYVQLSAVQVARFASGPALTALMNSRGGPLYYVQGAQRHEVLDAASQNQAGITGAYNTLSATALSSLAIGKPIVRDDVYVTRVGSATGVLLVGGKASPVDQDTAAVTGLSGKSVGTLQGASIAQLPAGPAFSGALQTAGSSTVSVVASDGVHTWAAGVGGAAFTPLTASSALLSGWAARPAVQVGSAVKSNTNATVYLVMPGNIRPISSWDALIALSGGGTPAITVVSPAIISALPKGPVALVSGTMVRNASSATVYLVNGVTNKIPFGSFDPPGAAGFTQFTYTTDDRLAGYPTSNSLLGYGVLCGSQKYVSAEGSIHSVSSSLAAQYPFTYVQLDSFLCGLVKKGIDATAFIRTPDGTIYYLDGGKKHAISSMSRFYQLSAGRPFLNVLPGFASGIPTGPST